MIADIQLCACGCGRQASLQIGIDTSSGPMRFNCAQRIIDERLQISREIAAMDSYVRPVVASVLVDAGAPTLAREVGGG